jgi:hypothetical protein
MTSEEHVVVVSVGFAPGMGPRGKELGGRCSSATVEVFRGSAEEAKRIKDHLAPAYNDRHRIICMQAMLGPAEDWDEFLQDLER